MTILCKPEDCTLLVVDTQTKLMPAIHDGETVVRRCVQLATAAHELGIHVIGTEENPDGLGPLVAEIAALCDTTLQKFYSRPVGGRLPAQASGRRDTPVVAGCRRIVCVMQTWLPDRVRARSGSSTRRSPSAHRHAATERVRSRRRRGHHRDDVFEWLGTSQHPVQALSQDPLTPWCPSGPHDDPLAHAPASRSAPWRSPRQA